MWRTKSRNKGDTLKKLILFALFVGTFIVFSMSSGLFQIDKLPSTIGVRLDRTTSCNDRYLVLTQLDTNIYEAHGYEYGCGFHARACSGTVHIYGGYAYFSLTENSNGRDYGTIGSITAPINLSSKTGTGTFMYIYFEDDTLSSHGSGSANFAISISSYPDQFPVETVVGPDDAIR
jgi:hypothetical protein